MLRVAVIGLGTVSSVHLAAIHDANVELVAVCDIDESLKEKESEATFYTDYHEMLQQEKLDCVHICLPHHLHYPATKACVEHGVHVFVEKPLARDLQQSEAFVQLAKKHPDVKIGVCLQNRWNETSEKMKEIIDSNTYGKVKSVKGLVAWYRPESYYTEEPWRGKMDEAGGGVMNNQSIHTLDLLHVFGGQVESLRGSVAQLSGYEIEVEDTATANLSFANGAKGLFFATITNAVNSSVEIEVHLEKAVFLIKDGLLMKKEANHQQEVIIEDGKLPGKNFYYGASHIKLIHHFYDCMEEDRSDYVTVEEAFVSMKLIDAIRKSAKTNQAVKLQ